MKVVDLKIDLLQEYENNPRFNENAVEKVIESIKQFGFKVPIVIDKQNIIIAGHTRYKAAQQLQLETVPCVIADDLTPEQVKAFRLADNKVSEYSSWDQDKLYIELMELKVVDFNVESFGFDTNEIDTLGANISGANVSPNDFNEDFSLPEGDKSEIEQITFTLHHEQSKFIKYAITQVEDCSETFGNTNKNGNAIHEVVKQWVELKK